MAARQQRSVPTVVVARTPTLGKEADFERWLRRLAAAARAAPGHVAADIQAPDTTHPGQWVIIYQFSSMDSLNEWLDSDERATFMAEGEGLCVGDAQEQVIALPHAAAPITAVASFRVPSEHEDRFTDFNQRMLECLSQAPGYVSSEFFEPVPDVQPDTVIVFSFDTRAHLDQWLTSETRGELVREIDQYIEGERTVNVVGGFGGWFARAELVEPRRWKQAAVVLLALYPTVLILTVVRGWLLPDVGLILGVLIGNIAGVAILTWVLMPPLTTALAGWLRR